MTDALRPRTPPPGGVTRDAAWVQREYGREKWPAIAAIVEEILAAEAAPTLSRVVHLADAAEIRAARSAVDPAGDRGVLSLDLTRQVVVDAALAAARDADLIIEVGSGWGCNVLRCWLAGGPAGALYCAAELTEAGRGVADRLAALEPALSFRSLPVHLGRCDLSAVAGVRRAVVFTCHSIEQVPNLPAATILEMASLADEVVGIHLEPVGWQEGRGPSPDAARRYAERNDYNRDLVHMLRSLHERRAIAIESLSVPALPWANPASAGCLIRWSARSA